MKTYIKLTILILALMAATSPAKAQHQVSLSWAASSDAAANPSLGYNVYRLASTCPTSSGTTPFTKVNSTPVTGTTFTDTGVSLGQVCYCVTATLNGAESTPSNTVSGVVLPSSPTALKITGQT